MRLDGSLKAEGMRERRGEAAVAALLRNKGEWGRPEEGGGSDVWGRSDGEKEEWGGGTH
jgi:hypothetical protein